MPRPKALPKHSDATLLFTGFHTPATPRRRTPRSFKPKRTHRSKMTWPESVRLENKYTNIKIIPTRRHTNDLHHNYSMVASVINNDTRAREAVARAGCGVAARRPLSGHAAPPRAREKDPRARRPTPPRARAQTGTPTPREGCWRARRPTTVPA